MTIKRPEPIGECTNTLEISYVTILILAYGISLVNDLGLYFDKNLREVNKHEMTFLNAKKLRTERRKRDVTQKELANAVGIDQASISLFESGKRNPSLETIVKIAKYLDVSLDYLTKGD